MTATVKADDKELSSLNGHAQTVAIGAQADGCSETTKAIAECVGRVHENEMQRLALNGKESTPTEQTHPGNTNVTNKDKAIWGKQHDLF